MSSIIPLSELAVDRRGKSFAPHPEAKYWVPKRMNGSQAIATMRFGQHVCLPIDANAEQFEESVGFVTGMYLLEQRREDLTVIADAPCAYIEVQGMDLRSSAQRVGAEELLGLAGQAIHANEKKDELLADVVKSMLHTQVQLQLGTVKVVDAVGAMLPVASGIQAIERPPPTVDVDEMATMLLEAMEEQREERDAGNDNREQAKPNMISQFMHSPFAKEFGNQFANLVMAKLFELYHKATTAAKNDNDADD